MRIRIRNTALNQAWKKPGNLGAVPSQLGTSRKDFGILRKDFGILRKDFGIIVPHDPKILPRSAKLAGNRVPRFPGFFPGRFKHAFTYNVILSFYIPYLGNAWD